MKTKSKTETQTKNTQLNNIQHHKKNILLKHTTTAPATNNNQTQNTRNNKHMIHKEHKNTEYIIKTNIKIQMKRNINKCKLEQIFNNKCIHIQHQNTIRKYDMKTKSKTHANAKKEPNIRH